MRFLRLWLVLIWCGCAHTSPRPDAIVPAHHTEQGYTNPHIEEPDKSFFSFLRMRWFGSDKWADHGALAHTVPFQKANITALTTPSPEAKITWLGHSTFLIQASGINVLTDPIFSDRASPVSFAGPRRYVPHAFRYDQLPPIDLVVISHNHYDHLDEKTISQLSDSTDFAVPLGIDKWLIEQGISTDSINAFDWWDAKSIRGVVVTATPSQHWSARGLNDRFETLWASWSLQIGELHIWFAGDTGYNPIQFKEIGNRLPPIDTGLIPIGAYAPRWFMQAYHVNPSEAVQIHKDIDAAMSIGMHWGTFPLTAEAPMAPVEELHHILQQADAAGIDFRTLAIGQTVTLTEAEYGLGSDRGNR